MSIFYNVSAENFDTSLFRRYIPARFLPKSFDVTESKVFLYMKAKTCQLNYVLAHLFHCATLPFKVIF